MTTLFAKHKVKDFQGWKRVYDNLAQLRNQNGVTSASVHQDPQNSNEVIVTHQFKNVNAAMTFVNSNELKEAMEKSGVISQPEMWFGNDVEHTPY
ncbi:antibiotic biosynthesis monooxygenase [candidate division KSB1 bacterium]|nr:antibiotic biosynthesis monooxygenase [candidate division KSB1 bacterium]